MIGVIGPRLVSTRQLKAARALAALTQADLGSILGVDQRQIRFWERRLPNCSYKLANIERALAACGVELTANPAGVRLAVAG
jgi:transcriptional regulator with XRE-family HTH domain